MKMYNLFFRTIVLLSVVFIFCLSIKSKDELDNNKSYFFTKVHFTNENVGWILCSNSRTSFILNSTNGGDKWEIQYKTSNGIFDIEFVNESIGWAVGSNGLIIRTFDGGKIWTKQIRPTEHTLMALSVVSKDVLFASGTNGTLLNSNDGGNTWRSLNVPVNNPLSSVRFSSRKRGVVLGYKSVFFTDDSKTWINKEVKDFHSFENLTLVNDGVLFTSGPHLLYVKKMNDDQLIQIKTPGQGKISDLAFLNDSTGWLTKTRGVDGTNTISNNKKEIISEGLILKSNDGGITWMQKSAFQSYENHTYLFTSVFFVNESTGWVLSRNGNLLKTMDGGTSWKEKQVICTQ